MQGQVDQQRVELPAPWSTFHHRDVIVHYPGQQLEGSARPLFLNPCLWWRAQRSEVSRQVQHSIDEGPEVSMRPWK